MPQRDWFRQCFPRHASRAPVHIRVGCTDVPGLLHMGLATPPPFHCGC